MLLIVSISMRKFFLEKLLLVFIFHLFIYYPAASQKQASHWYFGQYAGLDFSSGSPVADNAGQIHYTTSNVEGCASISDSSGMLLFYTDGEVIYNRLHLIMFNGLGLYGGQSSSQSSVIVPMPGDPDKYYVFTTDDFIHNLDHGLNYSIVDMCLASGYGGVMSNFKNVHLLDTASEKVAVCRHSNGTDFWVLTQKHFTNEFYAFQVTATGISNPVMTATGPVHGDGTVYSSIGEMKIAPDGSRIALVDGQGQFPYAEILDFDNSTGVISNPDTLLSVTYPGPYVFEFGVSFSPNSQLVYFAICGYGQGIRQVDAATGTILYNIPVSISTNMVGLQLGPYGKIYCVNQSVNDSVSVINDPDQIGAACNFQLNAIGLNGGLVTFAFPEFIDDFSYPNTTPACGIPQALFTCSGTAICPGTCTSFLNFSSFATSYQWFFPGATPDTSTLLNPSNICYAASGSYDVQLIISGSNGSDTLLQTNLITVYPSPPPQSITQSGDTLFAISGSASYQWYFNGSIINGATAYSYAATQSGDYNVVATDANGCEVEAAIFSVVAGIPFLLGHQELSVYPDPVTNYLKIEYKFAGDEAVSIYDFTGRKIILAEPESVTDHMIIIKNIATMPQGVYVLEISGMNKQSLIRFIKQ